jgi:resuscitation-promoting factor RpfB
VSLLLPGAGKALPELEHIHKKVTTNIQPIKAEQLPQPLPKAETVVEKKTVSFGSHEDWMKQVGIPESDWSAVDYILSHESNWRVGAVNSSSGATGICQALPAQKMQSAGLDYMTNPITQLKWCNDYANSRYGGWQQAYQFWVTNKYW